MMANPCTLRQEFGALGTRPLALRAPVAPLPVAAAAPMARGVPPARNFRVAPLVAHPAAPPPPRRRSDSPPRMQFKVLQARGPSADARSIGAIQLSLASLNMNNRTH
ncbi:MAG: hypothetical protein ACKVI4_17275 [Actinomycetales bacterium]